MFTPVLGTHTGISDSLDITLYIDTIMDNTGTSILIIKKDTNILLSLGRG